MTAFPDMVVKMDHVSQDGSHAIFRWTWTGTNSGPGGTGKSVRINGYEEWTMGADGLIAASEGHFDEAEYQRQLKSGAPPAPRSHLALATAAVHFDRHGCQPVVTSGWRVCHSVARS